MKYLLTTKDGLNDFHELLETPSVDSFLTYKEDEYKVVKIINNTDFIEVQLKPKFKPKPFTVNWN